MLDAFAVVEEHRSSTCLKNILKERSLSPLCEVICSSVSTLLSPLSAQCSVD